MKNEKIESAVLPDFNAGRRNLLRSALAAGCALCVPVTWAAGTAPGEAQKLAAEKSNKVSKEQVKYQDTPKDKQQCAICNNFIAPDACKLVEGKISPAGWCALFTPKAA